MNVFFLMLSPVSSSFCTNCHHPFPVGPLCSGRKSEPCLICRQHRLSGGVVGEVGVEGSFQGETSQVLQDCGLMICSCLFSRCVSTTMISWWSWHIMMITRTRRMMMFHFDFHCMFSSGEEDLAFRGSIHSGCSHWRGTGATVEGVWTLAAAMLLHGLFVEMFQVLILGEDVVQCRIAIYIYNHLYIIYYFVNLGIRTVFFWNFPYYSGFRRMHRDPLIPP